jgi:hypothetical protein
MAEAPFVAELSKELAALFESKTPALKEAAEKGDGPSLKAIAHELKGSCSGVAGICKLSTVYQELENCAINGDTKDAIEIIDQLLEEAKTQLSERLDEYVLRLEQDGDKDS